MPRAAATAKRSKADSPADAPVVALVGPEPQRQREALAEVAASVGADAQRFDFEGPSAEPGDVFDEARSVAMFGGRRLVVVRDADEFVSRNREATESFLQSLGPAGLGGNVLVLRFGSLPKTQRVYKMIDKVGRIVPCEAVKGADAAAWVVRRGKDEYGLSVSREAANLLADLVGADLGSLDNELAKLSLRAEGGKVTPEMIAGGVAFRREQEMWRLTDALTAGRPGQAMEIWRQLLATDPAAEFRAITWLAIWLDKAAGALRLSRRGDKPFAIAKTLRIWPANNVDALLATATALGESGLHAATDRLAEADYRIKTGLGAGGRVVEDFIVFASRGTRG